MISVDPSTIVASKGDAAGKLTGFNHLVLFVADMTEAIHFYRDLLGLTIVKTLPGADLGDENPVGRQYFFQLSDSSLVGIVEYPEAAPPSRSVFTSGTIDSPDSAELWPGGKKPLNNPQKVNHFAFNVASRTELEFFRNRLEAAGVPVSNVIDFKDGNGAQFVMSIYFYDPFGNPLEISTFDFGDPNVEQRLRRELWYADGDAPQALFE
jgi:catechol 2,3-dioxygenase-like lactoylglutathione lyase family enzyme